MNNRHKCLVVAVFANKKLLPAFEVLQSKQPVHVLFSDWSLKPSNFANNISNIFKSDIVYFHSPANMRIMLLPVAKLLLKRTMLQWIGGDVLLATSRIRKDFIDIGKNEHIPVRDYTLKGLKGLERFLVGMAFLFSPIYIYFLKLFVSHHVACAPHLCEELADVGIRADYLPLINPIAPELLTFPKKTAVLSYIGYFDSSDTKDYYGWQTIKRVASVFPHLTIYTIGRGQSLGDLPSNIVHLGFVDNIKEVLLRVKGVLRVSYYDGTPRLLVEALATGRYVAYTRPFPNCDYVDTYDDVLKFMRKLERLDSYNKGGYDYIISEYSTELTTGNYLSIFRKCLDVNGNGAD